MSDRPIKIYGGSELKVVVDTRCRIFEPDHFHVNEKLMQLEPDFSGPLHMTEEFHPTKKEFQLMRKEFMAHAEKQTAFEPLVKIASTSVVTKAGAEDKKFAAFKAIADVTVFTGRGKPTGDDAGSYQKIQLGDQKTKPAGARFRWTKIGFAADGTSSSVSENLSQMSLKETGTVSESLSQMILRETRKDYIRLRIPMQFRVRELKLFDIVDDSGSGNPQRRSDGLNTLSALIAKGTNTSPTAMNEDVITLHGNKVYNALQDKVTTVKGLDYLRGTARQVGLLGESNDKFLLLEKDSSKFFFPSVSVADFLNGYLSTTPSLSHIEGFLVGVKVRIGSRFGHEDKQILKLDQLPASVHKKQKHPAWVAKGGTTLQNPHLPCVNVGTFSRPELVPAEMCKILPMQSVGKKVPVEVQLAVSRLLRKADQARKEVPGKEAKELAFSSAHPKVSVATGKQMFKDALGNPMILFVEAGAGDKPPAGWQEMCKRVVSNAATTDAGDTSLPDLATLEPTTLSLSYAPGIDPRETWKQQLSNFTNVHAQDVGTERKILLVVAVMTGEHHKAIYETLKTICDSKGVIGKQTFFVNMGNLMSKERESPTDGAKKAANEISQRMRIRNPVESTDEAADISIGIEITPFIAHTTNIAKNGALQRTEEKQFLVTVGSREVHKPQGFNWSRELVEEAAVNKLDISKYIQPHLEGRNPKRVIVFRSGYVPAAVNPEPAPQISGRSMVVPQRDLQPDLSGDFELSDFTKAEDGSCTASVMKPKPKPDISIAASVNAEVARLQSGLPKVEVSYILIDEKDAHEIPTTAKKTIAEKNVEGKGKAKVAAKADAEAKGVQNDVDSLRYSVSFAVQKPLGARSHTIKMHRPMAPKSGTKSISLTLLGSKLAEGNDPEDEEPSSSTEPSESQRSSPSRDESEKHSYTTEPSSRSETSDSHEESDKDEDTPRNHQRTGTGVSAVRDPKTLSKIRSSPQGAAQMDSLLQPQETKESNYAADRDFAKSASDEERNVAGMTAEEQAKLIQPAQSQDRHPPLNNERQGRGKSPDSSAGGASAAPLDVTIPELRLLAQLFYDTRLELYDTKLPIPTYLARAMAKRAVMHLKHARNNEMEKPALPEVADEVGSSLYFL